MGRKQVIMKVLYYNLGLKFFNKLLMIVMAP